MAASVAEPLKDRRALAEESGDPAHAPATAWAAYGACAWAVAFAAMSFYWAAAMSLSWPAEGILGIETQGHAIKELALAPRHDPKFVALLWGTGVVKVIAALLALVRPWGQALPRPLLLAAAWTAGVGMTAYGGIPFVVNGLMLAGVLNVPGSVDWTAIRWHFVLWDPWFTVGGILFALAARQYRRYTAWQHTGRLPAAGR